MEHRLQVANISLTSRCNLSCKHCGAPDSVDEIPFYELVRIIGRLKEYGVKHIIFAGGEPFLRKDIFDVFEECERLKISFAILTNGTAADSLMIQRLSQYQFLSYVRVSVDYASYEKMDLFRGMSHIMDKINMTIELLHKWNIPFGIGLTIMDDNMDDIYPIAVMAKESGASFFRASPVVSIGKSAQLQHNEEFYCKAIQYMLEVRKRMNIGEGYPFIMLPNPLNKIIKTFLLPCPGGEEEVSIMADGTVNRCPLSQLDTDINIYKISLDEAVDSIKKDCQNKSEHYLSNIQCSQCKESEKCKGGCFAEIESSRGGNPLCIKKIIETVCEHYGNEYRRILSNILYEQKVRGNQPGCLRSGVFWMIPFRGK